MECVFIDFLFFIKQAVHLIHNVLRQVYDSANDIQELVEHAEGATDHQLHVTRCFLFSSHFFKDEAGFTEQNERIEKLGLNLVLEVVRLNLQEAEDGHYLAKLYLRVQLYQVEETGDVLLQIKLDLNGMETGTMLPPPLEKMRIGYLLELIDFPDKGVHVFDSRIH